ncbi:M23 family metallopeptidase [soil metagenome]
MSEAFNLFKRIFVAIYLILLHIVAVYFIGERILAKYVYAPKLSAEIVSDPTEIKEVPTPLPVPSILYDPDTEPSNTNQDQGFPRPDASGGIIIPVAGVPVEKLHDSFSDARSDGRIHDAIDIPAPVGTPVMAAADGEIIKFFDSNLGGITIYQLSFDRKFVLYYAHLQRRGEDIKVGDIVKQGKTIGYVGDTGNAGSGNYHLHFSIAIVTDPKRNWEGVYINPYPLLKNRNPLN